jgi:hypothetical protein
MSLELHSDENLCRLTTMGKKDGNVRMSLQTLRVLELFLESPTEQLSGAEVHRELCIQFFLDSNRRVGLSANGSR